MGNNDNRVVTWSALNSFIIENGGSPKKPSGANSLALEYGEFSNYAPIATSTESGIVISNYTGLDGGAYTSKQLVIEKDVTWENVQPQPVYYTVSWNLTNASMSGKTGTSESVLEGSAWNGTILASSGYQLSSVSGTMGGADISQYINNGIVNIPNVTADVQITGFAEETTAPVIAVTSIAISPKTATIDLYNNSNTTLQYTVTYTPSDADNRSVTWASSNTAVATIDSNGIATALSVGTTTITATTPNGKSDTATLTVVDSTPAETYTYTINAGHESLEGRRAWFSSSDDATPYYSTTIQNGKAVFTTLQLLDTVKGYIESSDGSVYFAEPSLISTSNDGMYRKWNSRPTWMYITANTADSNYIGSSEDALNSHLYVSNVKPSDLGVYHEGTVYSDEPYGYIFLKWTDSASLYTNPHTRTYKISIDDSSLPYVCTNNGQTILRNGEVTINAQKQAIDWSKIRTLKGNSSESGWSVSISGNILTIKDGNVSHTNSINNDFGNMSASIFVRGIDPPFPKIPELTSTNNDSSYDSDQNLIAEIRIFV